ncbi:ferric iron reductase [Aliamphritea spongicola]|nr:ferric iron reductase [Aliamphritea spongicola]
MQSHIGELIKLLDGYYGLTAGNLWQRVSALLEQHLQRTCSRLENGEAILEQEMEAFFRQPWPATAFIRMRLQDQSEYTRSQEIPNPLTEGVVL